MRVTVSIFTDSSLNGSRSKKVKFPITPYEKFDILFLRDNVMQEFIKTVLDLRNSFDAPMPEKTNGEDIQHNTNSFAYSIY